MSYRQRIDQGESPDKAREAAAVAFGWEVARYGPLVKHHAFAAEREWRIVSPHYGTGDHRIEYRPGKTTIVPYCRFSILNQRHTAYPGDGDERFVVVVGPTADSAASQLVVQSLMAAHFGPGWCAHGPSDVPYKEW
jgi:hypothetical protein